MSPAKSREKPFHPFGCKLDLKMSVISNGPATVVYGRMFASNNVRFGTIKNASDARQIELRTSIAITAAFLLFVEFWTSFW